MLTHTIAPGPRRVKVMVYAQVLAGQSGYPHRIQLMSGPQWCPLKVLESV